MGKQKEDLEWKIGKRLRKWFVKTLIETTIFFVKIILVFLGLLLLVHVFGAQEFALFVIDITKETGKFILTTIQNQTVSS